ncbi:tetratricopeptide repeat protein [Acanthopleuribacter pedis]|uniref:LapB rubredoxin metal binding domain-containing protein n=1 Tax=Acanthopleuribacter pedis TaxID=442870 RepID=A0A8J7U3U7_9BACT|nr:tetratricopeptide repeat protein [Acanthopleuribacter pedis]MBO1319139.1 hypothetical protein [Acanthopleuribacter pedis]
MKLSTLSAWFFALLVLGVCSAVFLPPENQRVLLQPIQVWHLSFPLVNGVIAVMLLSTLPPALYLSAGYLKLAGQMRGVKRGNRLDLRAGEQLVHARGLLQHQDYQAALDAVGDDESVEAVLIKGEALWAMGDTEQAAAMLRPCFRQSGDVRIGYLLVEVLRTAGQNPIEVLDALITADPGHARAALKAACALYEQEQQWDLALATLSQLEKLGTDDCSTQRLRYEFKIVQTQPDETNPRKHIDRLQSFTKKTPEFVPAWLELGRVWWNAGNLEKAQQMLARGYQATGNLACLDVQVDFLLDDNRPEDAIQVYLAPADDKPAVRFQLAKLYFRLHMLDEALDQFEILEGLLPKCPSLLHYQAQIKARRDRYAEAAEDFQRYLGERADQLGDFVCENCGHIAENRAERCPKCGEWDTLVLEVETLKFEAAGPLALGPRYHGA